MTGIDAALLELVQQAETPLYSAYAWLGREFGRPLPMGRFLKLVNELVAEDKLRLWSVDPDAFERERLASTPRGLAEHYAQLGGLDPAFDPFGLSLTLGGAVDPDEEPDWRLDIDFEAEQFGLEVAPGKEAEALAQVGQFFPDVRLVERGRSQRDHRTRIRGMLVSGEPGAAA
jgi:hypothetical protein